MAGQSYDEAVLNFESSMDDTAPENPERLTSARKVTKMVVGGVAGVGAGMVINHVAKKYLPTDEMAFVRKVFIKIGIVAISATTVGAVKKHVNKEIDDFYDAIEDAMIEVTEEVETDGE